MKLFITTLLLALCAAQDLDFTPQTTPTFRPRPIGSIPPNRVRPAITNGDIVIAASERIGVVVDNLAQRLALDLKDILVNLPATPGIVPVSPNAVSPNAVSPKAAPSNAAPSNTIPPNAASPDPGSTPKRVMEGQQAVKESLNSVSSS